MRGLRIRITRNNTSMLRSLLIKLALLAGTTGLVVWLGWPVPPEQRAGSHSSSEPVRTAGIDRSQKPTGSAPTTLPDTRQSVQESGHRLDLNRASLDELRHLPGIGEVLAQRIVERRAQQGPFGSVDELLDVKGIGRKRLAELRPLVMVSSDHHDPNEHVPQATHTSRADRELAS